MFTYISSAFRSSRPSTTTTTTTVDNFVLEVNVPGDELTRKKIHEEYVHVTEEDPLWASEVAYREHLYMANVRTREKYDTVVKAFRTFFICFVVFHYSIAEEEKRRKEIFDSILKTSNRNSPPSSTLEIIQKNVEECQKAPYPFLDTVRISETKPTDIPLPKEEDEEGAALTPPNSPENSFNKWMETTSTLMQSIYDFGGNALMTRNLTEEEGLSNDASSASSGSSNNTNKKNKRQRRRERRKLEREQKQKKGEITTPSSCPSRLEQPHGTIRLVLSKPSSSIPSYPQSFVTFDSRPITLS